jgi:hypothetical protein
MNREIERDDDADDDDFIILLVDENYDYRKLSVIEFQKAENANLFSMCLFGKTIFAMVCHFVYVIVILIENFPKTIWVCRTEKPTKT